MKFTLATALICAGCVSATAFAQSNTAQSNTSMRFAGIDRDGDGVITRSEWRGNDQSFRMEDWNGDGVLSGIEVRPGARRPPNGTQAAAYRFDDWTDARFGQLDRNRDGRIRRDEWSFDRETFDRADDNRDAMLTRQEFRQARQELGTSGTVYGFNDWTISGFNTADRNRDNRIARSEWQFDRASFDRADDNSDSILTRREFLNVAQEIGTVGSSNGFADWTESGFANLDRNRDNRITRAEWTFDAAAFNRADDNRDSILTRREFLSVSPAIGVGTSGSVTDFHEWTEARFNQLDSNRDNRISRPEWQFSRDSFDRADFSGDGVLTRSEFLGLEGVQRNDPVSYNVGERFDRLDVNNDGWIASSEWTGTRAAFDALDRNRDRVLNRDEFTRDTTAPQQNAAYQLGYERGITEGRAAGIEDRQRNQGWDLEGQRELQTADSGYEARFGVRGEYQNGYRAGFRLGYPEGWNSAR